MVVCAQLNEREWWNTLIWSARREVAEKGFESGRMQSQSEYKDTSLSLAGVCS